MKIQRWEILLAVILVTIIIVVTTVGAVVSEQNSLSEKLVRIHIIANSDSASDQNIKLYVRDEVNRYVADIVENCTDAETAAKVISDNIENIQNIAEDAVIACGASDPVTAELTEEYYPTREYESFSLPAGEYTSLQIKIGEAEGQNWWCVVFPPLCTEAAEEEYFTELDFSENELELITDSSGKVVFKFKILEYLNVFRELISGA